MIKSLGICALTSHKSYPTTIRDLLYCSAQVCIPYHIGGFKHVKAKTKWSPFLGNPFKCIFLNENVWISIKISLNFVLKGPSNNIPAFVLIMAWLRLGDTPLFETMKVTLLTRICVTRPEWVKYAFHFHITSWCVLDDHCHAKPLRR